MKFKETSSYKLNYFLNEAYKNLILKLYKSGFEKSEFERNIISQLKKDGEITDSVTGYYKNGLFFELPADVWFLMNEKCDITFNTGIYDATEVTNIHVKPVDDDYYNLNKDNPSKQPDKDIIWRISVYKDDVLRRVELIGADNYGIDTYYIRYLKNITDINTITGVDCEIDDNFFHEQIVNEAIRIAKSELIAA